MKVLLITVKSQVSKGGIASWTEGFLTGCQKKEMEIDIVNTEVIGDRLNKLTSGRNFWDEYKRTTRILSDLRKMLKRKTTYDVVHLNTSCGTFGIIRDLLIARYVKNKKIPLVTHYHCDIPYWIKKFYSKWALTKLAKLSEKNIVLCENSKKYLKTECGTESVIVPNFVADELVISNPKLINEEIKTIAFVGRVSRAKGAMEIYELAKRLPEITFELIGEVSDEFLRIIKPENVVLVGAVPHEELIKHLDMADAFVFPSHSEGFSIALTEAMARGLPCIATDVGANADMLSGECGYVVAVGDVDSMEIAIKKLASWEARKQLSEKTVKKIKNNYIVDSIVRDINKLYLSVQ